MKILVIDIETTGFLRQGGKIVEIGIVELCLATGSKQIIYDKVINPEQDLEKITKSWIVESGYMQPEEILNGVLFHEIKDELQAIINNYPEGATAYNRDFDVNFLENYGINFIKKLPCPMVKSTNICKLKNTNGYSGYKWPKAEEAYRYFYPDQEYVEKHRGADDAIHEAGIILALHKLNKFID